MSGYSAPYIGLPDPEKRPAASMETPASQQTISQRGGKSWYRKLSFNTKSNSANRRSSMVPTPIYSSAKNQEEHFNKPLPPLPSPQEEPYFEYMFADAGIKNKKSDESMKSGFGPDIKSPGKQASAQVTKEISDEDLL